MKKILAVLLWLSGLPGLVVASPYIRFMDGDPAHPSISTDFNIAPKNLKDTTGVLDIAILTHANRDGSIIPVSWRSWLPPESWVPFQLGFGGSIRGNAVISPGTSANISPIIAQDLLGWVGNSSSSWLQAVKAGLAGSGAAQVHLGVSLQGQIVNGGTWQSAKEAFPGRGIGEIIGNAARVNAGLAWKL